MRDNSMGCGFAEWECVLLSHDPAHTCNRHWLPIARARREAKQERVNNERQALIKKYDEALKALDKHPMTIVESTYRGLLGEFAREWEEIQ